MTYRSRAVHQSYMAYLLPAFTSSLCSFYPFQNSTVLVEAHDRLENVVNSRYTRTVHVESCTIRGRANRT